MTCACDRKQALILRKVNPHTDTTTHSHTLRNTQKMTDNHRDRVTYTHISSPTTDTVTHPQPETYTQTHTHSQKPMHRRQFVKFHSVHMQPKGKQIFPFINID